MQEDEALYFFKQLVHAVDYCHRHHVVHRDLKVRARMRPADRC